jgi:tRNA (guanosine-2'-O-)-methyltransferase
VSRGLQPTELKRLHRAWRRRTSGRVALILEDVQNPFNVGAILRAAAAWSVEALWLVGSTARPDHPKVGKTALGCQRYLTWHEVASIGPAVQAAHEDGYRVVGIELAEGARPLHELALPPDVALVVGHEDRGLSRDALAVCDELAFVPLLGRVGSLNVATATAVAVYEARRRAWT